MFRDTSEFNLPSLPKVLAESHWNNYVEPLLIAHGEDETVIVKCKFHYISAWIHGAKHSTEVK